MLKKIGVILVVLVAAAGATLWVVAAPTELPEAAFEGLGEPDVVNGELVFIAGGCASCHAAVETDAGTEGEAEEGDPLLLAGGLAINSDFGTFHVPNISPSAEGIGDWSFENFANAMLSGVTPGGGHYYPAFPYPSYARTSIEDVHDLWGYMRTLPESDNQAPPHDIPFPYDITRAVGLWKYLYMTTDPRVAIATDTAEIARGRYLVEGLGHCGACHTPRGALGGFVENMWLAGAPNPDGEGTVPNITPGGSVGDWSEDDLVYYFETGFTPDFDSVGGPMVEVQEDLARLPAGDREAIAAYLKAIPAR